MPTEQIDSKEAEDILSRFNTNSSYTKEYHQKYFYPKIVYDRIVARKLVNKSKGKGRYSCEEDTCSGQVCSGCNWYLDPCEMPSTSQLHEDCKHKIGKSGISRSTLQHMDTTAKGMAAEEDSTALDQWAGVHRAGMSSSSVTSEDSVFSEDYTVMENGEVKLSDIKRDESWAGGSEADSSFSSPISSTSTLEADGKQDGDCVKDVAKDKVIGSNDAGVNPPLSRQKPHIRLLLANTEFDEGPCEGQELVSGETHQEESAMKSSDSSSFYEDKEFEFLKTEPIRRSTSLKTYKTPPGTPSRKKAVRFADALGLDLESVRHILNLEEPPEVPKSAMRDLVIGYEEDHKSDGVKYLSALFSQPGVDPGFNNRVNVGKVALENLIVDDKDMTLAGTIRVANVSYHKQVIVRFTCNNWVSSDDITASYVLNSNDGNTDRFSFTLNVPNYFSVGQRLEFCLLYNAGGQNFWDNNYGTNYAIECYARAMPLTESDNTWMHFL